MNRTFKRLYLSSIFTILFLFLFSGFAVVAQDVRSNETRTVQVMNLIDHPEKDVVTYSVDSHVRSASYRYYHFDRASFFRFFDGENLPTEPFEAEIRFLDNGEMRTYTPSNPMENAPAGGIQLYDYRAELISVNGNRAQQQQPNTQRMPDAQADAIYHNINLEADFSPDPLILELDAGGSTPVPISGCEGFINSDAPDAKITYTGGMGYPLSFYAQSWDDVTLLIKTPNGDWICESNTGDMQNALIYFYNPPSGEYAIWVGTRQKLDDYPEATISISEETFPDSTPALRIR